MSAIGTTTESGKGIRLWRVLLFVYLLNLPFQLWPVSNAFSILWGQFEDIARELWFIISKLLHVA